MKNNQRGVFIVLEGLDKCGKSTQCELLSEALEAKKLQFPDRSTSMSLIISDYLKGKRDINDQVVHLLFSANRWEAQYQIKQNQKFNNRNFKQILLQKIKLFLNGINIVCDRYAYSGVAFSSAKGLLIQWCKQSDSGLPKPDLVRYLRAPIKQLKDRGDIGAERYEKQEFQSQVKEFFDKMAQEEQFQIINAIQTKEEIFSQIMELINDYNSMPQIIQLNNFGVELSYFIHFIIYLNLAYNFFFFNFKTTAKQQKFDHRGIRTLALSDCSLNAAPQTTRPYDRILSIYSNT